MKILKSLVAFALIPCVAPPAVQSAPRTYQPQPGSMERKAILDALRKPISHDLKRKVIFKVYQLKVCDGWAWAMVDGLNPDGSRLGMDDLWGSAQGLLRKKSGRWTVLVSGIATDVAILEEAKSKYPQAPRSIFTEDRH